MEFKHFSHPHALSYHQAPETREAICSGCKSPLSSGSVYSCWHCNFFLHEQCFNAARSMDHPSHQSHPLSLFPSPTYPSGSFFCNFCNLTGTGFSYSCSSCEFDLHVHCAYMPLTTNHSCANQNHSMTQPTTYGNLLAGLTPHHTFPSEAMTSSEIYPSNPPYPYVSEATSHVNGPAQQHAQVLPYTSELYPSNPPFPRITEPKVNHLNHTYVLANEPPPYGLPGEIQHKSHPQHSLVFLLSPPYKENGEFTCNACFSTGTGFDYHCKICRFDLHVGCARLSENVKRGDHEHPLRLLFSSPYKKGEGAFCCDVCKGVVEEGCWVYYCQECDFGTHLDCVMADRKEADEETEQNSEANSLVAAQMRLQQLQLQMQMNQQVVKMSQQNAQFMISMGQSLANLAG